VSKPDVATSQEARPGQGADIAEKAFVTINGVRQGMFIRAKDRSSPVLLYLHGGMPEFFLARRYPTGLDEDFTVVWWEQRGSGLSFDPHAPPERVTPAQLISDTLELTRHLQERFAQPKIYLMGHSGGSFLGLQAAALAPELFHAYVAVAQMSRQLRSEQRAYDYMLRRFREQRDAPMVRRLEASPPGDSIPLPRGYMAVRDLAMHRLGVGTTRDLRSVLRLVLLSLSCRDYTLHEKVHLWRGKLASRGQLWNAQLAADLTREVPRLALPVYFLHGLHDYTVSYVEAKAYFQQLSAPLKGFYTFERSAHSPMFEEPERVREILRADVLAGTNQLADT
jgi:pimeloyl-ACP methyl ester carboxylesterase